MDESLFTCGFHRPVHWSLIFSKGGAGVAFVRWMLLKQLCFSSFVDSELIRRAVRSSSRSSIKSHQTIIACRLQRAFCDKPSVTYVVNGEGFRYSNRPENCDQTSLHKYCTLCDHQSEGVSIWWNCGCNRYDNKKSDTYVNVCMSCIGGRLCFLLLYSSLYENSVYWAGQILWVG